MIESIGNNRFNERLVLNPIEKIKEKLDYYRSLFNKIDDLPDGEFENLKKDIAKFFNVKPGDHTYDAPPRLVRISNNNRILESQGKELSYLTDISQLLAPPIKYCNFGRCNIPNQQILYCSTTEAGAYWETKPRKGDVITLSRFELKPGAKFHCAYIKNEKTSNPAIAHSLQEVYYILEEFFVDAFSLEVSRDKPKNYLFSALLSSERIFHPIVSEHNPDAILYPSVQKKKFGQNLAIRNDLIFEKYKLRSVETRFILDEYENLDPASDDITTDQVIGSFGTNAFDFQTGKILYNEKADEIFNLFRMMQMSPENQTRYEYPDHPEIPKNLAFNMAPKGAKSNQPNEKAPKPGRNDRVNVMYQNGVRKDNVKYKVVLEDILNDKCRIVLK